MSEMRLHDPAGNRLYLNAEERAAFLAVARRQPARDRTLCETLHFTGCRPSELVEITPARVDLPESLAARLLRSDLVSIPRLAPGEAVTLRLIGDARPTGPYRFEVESDGTTAIMSHRLVTDDSND